MRPIGLILGFLILPISAVRAGLPETAPERVGLDGQRLAGIDRVVREAIDARAIPGAVVVVGRHGKIAFARAYGHRAIEPRLEAMTRDTVFDMASLTKPMATATSILLLVDQGRLHLDDTLAQLLPEFDNHGKGSITLEQLLRHRTGLIPDNPLRDYQDGIDASWTRLAQLGLNGKPGEKFVYSDVNFEILGRIVERVSGTSLDAFSHERIFHRLGMNDTGFRPIGLTTRDDAHAVKRIAPTEPLSDGQMLRGLVHDPRSRLLGGVAGHAGLFSSADDVAVFAQMILNEGRDQAGRTLLSSRIVRAMIDPGETPARQKRGLGWDIDTGYSAPRGERFGPRSFGHTGFTGTSLWIDPDTEMFVILLTSRLHPDGKAAAPNALRSAVATIAAGAIQDDLKPSSMRCGIDVLIHRQFEGLTGKRVGLVTNHTGLTRDGRSTIDVLYKAPEVKLVALFSPEHGIRGEVDREIADSQDEVTHLPVFSLYGKTRKPTAESLAGLDVLVYDIQDIGTRFYTYISTLGLVLEAAKAANLPVFVLDRPNPIGGVAVAGPVREEALASFIAYHALPVRHGMTVGELAWMFNVERGIDATLKVIPCEGWRRDDLYDRTGLLWVNPSPNMRSLTEALLYPGVGLLEATNLATGRGTDTPFERLGAPYIEPIRFAAALNELGLPGIRFLPIRFTPKERQFAGQVCGGVFLQITDRSVFEPVDLGLGLAVVLRRLYPDQWEPEGVLRFVGDRAAFEAIRSGKTIAEIKASYQAGLEAFEERRRGFLLYR